MNSAVNNKIVTDSSFINLKQMPYEKMRPEVNTMLIDGEEIVCIFRTIRDQVIFTTLRVIVINVQGITGAKVSYFSYPYKRIAYWGLESAGLADIDSELVLYFINGGSLQFDFVRRVDIRKVCNAISQYML